VHWAAFDLDHPVDVWWFEALEPWFDPSEHLALASCDGLTIVGPWTPEQRALLDRPERVARVLVPVDLDSLEWWFDHLHRSTVTVAELAKTAGMSTAAFYFRVPVATERFWSFGRLDSSELARCIPSPSSTGCRFSDTWRMVVALTRSFPAATIETTTFARLLRGPEGTPTGATPLPGQHHR
jgi:hypothetical protein